MDGLTSAHGLGGAKDLPIPAEYAILGAVAALLVSFAVLLIAWRTPRFESMTPGQTLPRLERVVDSTAFRIVLRGVGLVGLVYCLVAIVLGQDLLTNPIFGIVYVLIWVGIVPASLLLGPVWKAISPFRTINRALSALLRTDPETGLYALPQKVGVWPAALGLYAFVWLELVVPTQADLGTLRLWLVVYAVIMVTGAALFGQRFLAAADPFEVYSSLLAKLSVWGRRQGRLVLVSPLRNLASTEPRPGLAAVMAVLLGSTAYDSFRESPLWLQFRQSAEVDGGLLSNGTLLNNAALLLFCLLAGVILMVGTMATGVGPDLRRGDLPRRFAHALIPIVVGYMVAHYFSYFVFMSQDTLIKMSDPLSRGDNWFGTGDWVVSNWLAHQATGLAVLKVLAVVGGHVAGAVASHDRALSLLPQEHRLSGQIPLMAAMVVITAGGLYLLFAS